ncbi:hypothetical protein HK105_207510, partial [Polyrhizophydium stewartii]
KTESPGTASLESPYDLSVKVHTITSDALLYRMRGICTPEFAAFNLPNHPNYHLNIALSAGGSRAATTRADHHGATPGAGSSPLAASYGSASAVAGGAGAAASAARKKLAYGSSSAASPAATGSAAGSDVDDKAAARKRKITHSAPSPGECTWCGTRKTAQWRKGPTGPRGLCNACGLEWAKQIRHEAKRLGISNFDAEMTLIKNYKTSDRYLRYMREHNFAMEMAEANAAAASAGLPPGAGSSAGAGSAQAMPPGSAMHHGHAYASGAPAHMQHQRIHLAPSPSAALGSAAPPAPHRPMAHSAFTPRVVPLQPESSQGHQMHHSGSHLHALPASQQAQAAHQGPDPSIVAMAAAAAAVAVKPVKQPSPSFQLAQQTHQPAQQQQLQQHYHPQAHPQMHSQMHPSVSAHGHQHGHSAAPAQAPPQQAPEYAYPSAAHAMAAAQGALPAHSAQAFYSSSSSPASHVPPSLSMAPTPTPPGHLAGQPAPASGSNIFARIPEVKMEEAASMASTPSAVDASVPME